MKNTATCPKCKNKGILKIHGNVGAYGSGNNIKAGFTTLSSVTVTRYLCTTCGYTEEWIDDPNDIAKLKNYYYGR